MRRSVAVAAVVLGCSAPRPPSIPAPGPAPVVAKQPAPVACPAGATTITGTVVDDRGVPVRDFAIIATSNFTSSSQYGASQVFTPTDGQFHACAGPKDSVDLIVVGPSFARTTVAGVALTGAEVQLGTISVTHGATVTGVVLTADGLPVRDARVRIEQTAMDIGDPYFNLAKGNFATRTDENGHFVISNYQPEVLGNGGSISASDEARVSPRYEVDTAAPMTLTVDAGGGVELDVANAPDALIGLASHAGDSYIAAIHAGHASFPMLPAGRYTALLFLKGSSFARLGDVTVTAGQHDTVSLTYAP